READWLRVGAWPRGALAGRPSRPSEPGIGSGRFFKALHNRAKPALADTAPFFRKLAKIRRKRRLPNGPIPAWGRPRLTTPPGTPRPDCQRRNHHYGLQDPCGEDSAGKSFVEKSARPGLSSYSLKSA